MDLTSILYGYKYDLSDDPIEIERAMLSVFPFD